MAHKNKQFKEKIRQSREIDRQRIREIYSKYKRSKKQLKFIRMDQCNINRFFNIRRDFWEFEMSKSALTLYPVMCSLSDFREDKFRPMSLEKLEFYSGLSRMTVIKCIDELTELNFIEKKKQKYDGIEKNLYKVNFARYRNENSDAYDQRLYPKGLFPFYSQLIDSGLWRDLSKPAKALYLSLRSQGEIPEEILEEIYQYEIPTEEFTQRDFDIFSKSIGKAASNVHITKNNATKYLNELERFHLINRIIIDDNDDSKFVIALRIKYDQDSQVLNPIDKTWKYYNTENENK